MAFVERLISVQFILGTGKFGGGSPTDTVALFSGTSTNSAQVGNLRITVKTSNAGGFSMATAEIAIYGLSMSMINQLATYGYSPLVRQDSVVVTAGDAQFGMSTVFQGTINNAWADFSAMPDVPLRISAVAGLINAVKNAPSQSFSTTVDAGTLMQTLAGQMGLKFEGNGVSVPLSTPHLSGSYREQAKQVAEAAGIDWTIENNILAISKPGMPRQGNPVIVSVETGMVGYPTFWASGGVIVRKLFDSNIRNKSQIQVQSSLTNATGAFVVGRVDHDLAAIMPNGPWFTTAWCNKTNIGGVPPS